MSKTYRRPQTESRRYAPQRRPLTPRELERMRERSFNALHGRA